VETVGGGVWFKSVEGSLLQEGKEQSAEKEQVRKYPVSKKWRRGLWNLYS